MYVIRGIFSYISETLRSWESERGNLTVPWYGAAVDDDPLVAQMT